MDNNEAFNRIIDRLEREMGRSTEIRIGTIADLDPIDVYIGGATDPVEDVESLKTNLHIGDKVLCAVFGHDIVIIDRIGGDVARGCRVYRSTNQIISNNINSSIGFNAERYDSDGYHSTVSNTSRITTQCDGIIHIGASVQWAHHASGVRDIGIRVNGGGALIAYRRERPDGAGTQKKNQVISTNYGATKDDYFEVIVYQNSGGNLNIETAANYSPEFWMHEIRS